MYYDGHGVAQNYAKAREWWEKAAAQGYADAAYKLGRLYDDAHDKTKAGQYYETARQQWEKAANAGDADAQYWLGLRYYDGWMGFRKDKVAAHVWLDKAAAHGDPDIQFHVGWRYYFNKDYDDARRWLQPIADSNSIHADMAARLLDSINFLQGKKRPPRTTSP